ncbi:MAG: STAS domain-containing protein [Acidobacteria bacterium]|jgi:anti-sigma B factor antagonist|nr:STAS domain-containing protein [Acidobacteriota bacterium]
MPMTMHVSQRTLSGGDAATVVTIGGRLDSDSARRFATEILPVLARRPGTLVFDLAGLDFMTSAGIGELFRAQKTVTGYGGQVMMTNLQPQIQKVLAIVKALPGTSLFASEAEMDEYLAAMQRKARETP